MAFATQADIATRLGRSLTVAEQAMAEQVIDLVTGMIASTVGEDDAWAAALDPVPAYYRVLCIEKVLTVGSNPDRVRSITEQLGSYASTKSFPAGDDLGIALTPYEQRRVRLVARGVTFQSVTLATPYSGDDGISDFSDLDFS